MTESKTMDRADCGDPKCVLCATRGEFPSLSLMQQPARGFETSTNVVKPTLAQVKAVTDGLASFVAAMPAPEGAPRPTIWPIGDGKWCCRFIIGGEVRMQDRRCGPVGFGGSATYAWNAWVTSWRAHEWRAYTETV